jgi:lambda repressor-like predicted transcriptional regulator
MPLTLADLDESETKSIETTLTGQITHWEGEAIARAMGATGSWPVLEPTAAIPSPSTGQPGDKVSPDASEQKSNVRKSVVEPLLKKRGWSIPEWAKNSKVDPKTAYNYLNGTTHPSAWVLKQLADSLGVSVEDLP